jgi:NADH-quinone oxidoreductase subunit M
LNLKDISGLELATIVPILIFIVWIGVYPNTFLKISEKSVQKIILNFDNAKIQMYKDMPLKPVKESQN